MHCAQRERHESEHVQHDCCRRKYQSSPHSMAVRAVWWERQYAPSVKPEMQAACDVDDDWCRDSAVAASGAAISAVEARAGGNPARLPINCRAVWKGPKAPRLARGYSRNSVGSEDAAAAPQWAARRAVFRYELQRRVCPEVRHWANAHHPSEPAHSASDGHDLQPGRDGQADDHAADRPGARV